MNVIAHFLPGKAPFLPPAETTINIQLLNLLHFDFSISVKLAQHSSLKVS